MLIGLYT